jgi:hypothetical protein
VIILRTPRQACRVPTTGRVDVERWNDGQLLPSHRRRGGYLTDSVVCTGIESAAWFRLIVEILPMHVPAASSFGLDLNVVGQVGVRISSVVPIHWDPAGPLWRLPGCRLR